MRINHNISALRANSLLNSNNNMLSSSVEKLSSGYKINRAADDAAGMAISTKMRTQIAALEQSSRNSADGISVVQTTEGALNEVHSMLQRMRELAVQAANDTNTLAERTSMQDEIDQLTQEIDRISTSTEFNTRTLLDGSLDRRSYTNNMGVKMLNVSDGVKASEYQITVTQKATQATTATTLYDTAPITAAQAGTLSINGESITISAGDSMNTVYEKIRDLGEQIGVTVTRSGNTFTYTSKEYGSTEKVELNCGSTLLAAKLGVTSPTLEYGTDCKVTPVVSADGFKSTATVRSEGERATISDINGFEMQVKIDPSVAVDTKVDITVLKEGTLTLQIGANEGQDVNISVPKVDTETLGIDRVNVCTQEKASSSITRIDNAITQVSAIRSKLGAYQNRLDHTVTNLDNTNLNLTEAMSRITDTDMATEMTRYTQLQVLVQAGTSVLSQANQLPQTVLSLIQG